MSDYSGRVVFVTGGASGIGFALAHAMADQGATVALADISAERVAEAAARLGPGHRGYQCDVTDRAALGRLAAKVRADLGRVDIVFVNAGVAVGGKLTETEPAEIDWLFDVNVRGAYNTVLAFHPLLVEQVKATGTARFVFTGSENCFGLPPVAEMTAYTATKHAILALADGLRRDLQGTGVEVSIVCPGLTATRLWDARSTRQEQYGGARHVPAEEAAQMSEFMSAHGQDPAETARLCLQGIERGEFIIMTDPAIRKFAVTRHDQVIQALDRLDTLLASPRS
jgi:NAD(P)-dependent dehydrogenase (short-subunit alcohol dehydrogenase family)